MACAEQPIKKRRLYESIPEPQPPPPEIEPSTAPSSFPAPVTPSPPTQEDIQNRSKNREEIRRVHDSYKRLKSCISQRDYSRSGILEQSYRSLISASTGCASAKRLVADLVPRYALYCPNAIGDAVQAVIDMHNFSLEAIKRGQDADGVSYQTAKACISGLVDLCSAASSKSASSVWARDICSAVFRNVLTFFVLSFEAKHVFQIVDKSDLKLEDPDDEFFTQLMQKLSDGNSSPLIKLSRFCVIALLKLFFYFPKNSISTCFGLFNSSSTEDVATGRYLITNMTDKINDIDAASSEPERGENSGQTGSNKIEATGMNVEGLNEIQEASNILKSCLLGMVFRKNPSVGRWACFKYRNICSLSSFIEVSSTIPSLEGIFGFLGKDIKPGDCQMESDEDDYGKLSASLAKPHTSAENDARSSAGSVYDAGGSRSMEFEGVDQRDLSCGRSSVPRGLMNHQTPSPSARMASDLRSNSADGRNNFVIGGSPYQAAPRGPSSGKILWYLDGDPAAFDIFPASGQLWLGYLGPDETEGHLRFQLDRYGPVDRFFFDPVKGFALAEYRSIIDAIRAREYMRQQFPWRIKFMDIGVGARGSFNGVAYGYCTHLYIGCIGSQWERDEIVHESRQALYKGPRMVTDLYYEHALLMEFDTPDDAAVVMAHLRFFRGEKTKFHLASINHPLPQEDGGSHPERHLQIPPTSKQVSGSGEYVSPLMSTDRHCNSVPPGATFQQNWPASGSTLVNSAQGGSGNHSCGPIPAPGQPITPTSQISPSPFVQQPMYPPPNSSWDTRYQISPSGNAVATPSQTHGPPHQQVSGPFMPPPVHPVSQTQGPQVQHFDQVHPPQPLGHSLSSVTHPPPPQPEMMPPPPLAPPPPMPQSHQFVPPPPIFPSSTSPVPPTFTQLSGLEASKQNVEHHWQGALSKSGVHYSTIVAQRLESDICKYIKGSSEPVQWPVKLDMTKRAVMKNVKSTFANTRPHQREVCQLIPATVSDRKGLQDFITYLKQRDCAGVIKIPATSPIWARHLFILPYSQETCSLLSISPGSSECLIGLVLPKEPNAECS